MVKELDIKNLTCNYIYKELQQCYKEHPIRRYTGFCSPTFLELQRCVEIQHEIRRKESTKKSEEMKSQMQTKYRKLNAENKN